MDTEKYYQNQRTEHVQHIIERMPTKFGFWVSVIVAVVFTLLMTFGWLVRYPDVLQGHITVNSNVSPIKLVANSSGKLKLLGLSSMDKVKEWQTLAYIENSTSPLAISKIDSLLEKYNPAIIDVLQLQSKFPHDFSLGELNNKYYSFYNALQEMVNYKQDGYFDKQTENLNTILKEQKNSVSTTQKRLEMAEKTLSYSKKFYTRDSILFLQRVISEAEEDKAQVNYLNSKDAVQSALNNLIQTKQAVQQTQSKIEEMSIQNPEKDKQLKIALISAYNDLKDNIKLWKQKYVFKAPFAGKVQFFEILY